MTGSMRITVIATGFDERRPSSMDEEMSAQSFFTGGKYSPSSFLLKKQKEEDGEDKKFRQFTQKNLTKNVEEEKAEQPAAKAKAEQDELEIPAFIRKKMGV